MLQVTETPIGPLFMEVSAAGISRIDFQPFPVGGDDHESPAAQELLDAAAQEIDEYFRGVRVAFDLPIDFATGTSFQKSVWRTIEGIGHGETLTYREVAAMVGSPNAYRAAGSACARNPIVILIPCHRVVGSDRGLHGFGGGLDVKEWLLQHEGSLDRFATGKRVVRRTSSPAVLV